MKSKNSLTLNQEIVSGAVAAAAFVAFSAGNAYAYIDPGTGASFVGSVVPLLGAFTAAVSALIVRVFWNPLRALFSKARQGAEE